MIVYLDLLDKIKPRNLEGFFVGWSSLPTPETLYKLLKESDKFTDITPLCFTAQLIAES